MGFQIPESAKEVRIDNYYRTVDNHQSQYEEVLQTLSQYKNGCGASQIYLHLNEKYLLTSVRRSLSELLQKDAVLLTKEMIGGKLRIVRVDSKINTIKGIPSKETLFKVNPNYKRKEIQYTFLKN
jgi:hypothetical protein